METARSPKQSTYEAANKFSAIAILLVLILFLSGCSNMTVVRLAQLCHEHEGKPAVSFGGESGKVECR